MRRLKPEKFDALYARVMEHLRGRELYVQDLFCGADPAYRLPVRIVNEYAWHNLFVRQLFIRPTARGVENVIIRSSPLFRRRSLKLILSAMESTPKFLFC